MNSIGKYSSFSPLPSDVKGLIIGRADIKTAQAWAQVSKKCREVTLSRHPFFVARMLYRRPPTVESFHERLDDVEELVLEYEWWPLIGSVLSAGRFVSGLVNVPRYYIHHLQSANQGGDQLDPIEKLRHRHEADKYKELTKKNAHNLWKGLAGSLPMIGWFIRVARTFPNQHEFSREKQLRLFRNYQLSLLWIERIQSAIIPRLQQLQLGEGAQQNLADVQIALGLQEPPAPTVHWSRILFRDVVEIDAIRPFNLSELQNSVSQKIEDLIAFDDYEVIDADDVGSEGSRWYFTVKIIDQKLRAILQSPLTCLRVPIQKYTI